VHHRRLKRLYNRLSAFLEAHAPAIAKSVNSGCSIADIERVETMTQEFTPDFRTWYMLLNGQKRLLAGSKHGLLGTLMNLKISVNAKRRDRFIDS
jgi:cell wall assembly regulator SMI1